MGTGSGPVGPEGHPFGWEASTKPNIARIYDAWLGGKENLAIDREIAARVAEVAPLVVAGVRANRAFLKRAIAFLAASGIDQFIDLGTVYVDSDPIVLVHARALLAVPSRTIVVEGDVRDPERILAHPELLAHIDFRRPTAVIMAAILHFVSDTEDPARIVRAFRDAMAPGSYLVITHVIDNDDRNGTDDRNSDGVGGELDAATRAGAQVYSESAAPFVVRSRTQVAKWFDGFAMVPPGLVDADAWRRTGTGKVTAPIVAAVGMLDGPETCTATADSATTGTVMAQLLKEAEIVGLSQRG